MTMKAQKKPEEIPLPQPDIEPIRKDAPEPAFPPEYNPEIVPRPPRIEPPLPEIEPK